MEKNIHRHRPTEKGKDNDPNVRDESAPQPGVNAISSSPFDSENEKLTKTAADDFREDTAGDEKADKTFDEVDED